jgi:hypothetical protein
MADERRTPHSLRDRSADQIRNEQHGGDGTPVAPERDGGIEGNASLRRVWSQPGGEANNYRNATVAAGTKSDGHGELTAAETPETTRHLSDATLSSSDKDATAEAIERATAVNGQDPDASGSDEAASTLGQDHDTKSGDAEQGPTPTTHTLRNPGGIASGLQRGGTVPGGGPGGSVGSIGTGGGSTAGSPTGSAKRRI